ncbi:MAG: methyltransferase domain-containing protein [archaeon]|nr:MAG: methyltransferase domain-containing protein [archaeon]
MTQKETRAARNSSFYFLEPSRIALILIVCGEVLMALGVFGAYQFGSSHFSALVLSYLVAIGGSAYMFAAVIQIWNSSVVKPREAVRLVKEIPWGGDEVVAEVLCGHGLITKEVAPRIPSGLVLALDVSIGARRQEIQRLDNKPQGGNGSKSLELASSDARQLPIKSGAIDLVLSGFGTGKFERLADRIYSVNEMVRVLKPGGAISMMVTGDRKEAEVMLTTNGLRDVKTEVVRSMLFSSARIVTGRKLSELGGSTV